MVHFSSEFEKVENWWFYGRFSCGFLCVLKLRSVYWGSDLRDGCMDSSDILQHDVLHQRVVGYLYTYIEKNENWRFNGNFSYFWVNIDFVHLDSELWHGWMDSSDILQHDDLYLWDETVCMDFEKHEIRRLYGCFSYISTEHRFLHLNAGLLHGWMDVFIW